MGRPLILAHRGFSARYPENTGLSFRRAIESGADGIECDLQKTRDGRFVVLHDPTIDRTSDGKGAVAGMTVDELRRFDFGSGERILELGELLALIPEGRWLNLEVKEETISVADCREIAGLLVPRAGRVLVSSFDHGLLAPFAERGIRTGALIGEEHGRRGIRGLIEIALSVRPTYMNLPIQAFERVAPWQVRALIGALRLLGRRVIFWTVNRREHFELVRRLSDMVITDDVEGALTWAGGE